MRTKKEPIAIVGMGCRLPGDANTPQDLWQNMLERIDAVTEIPSDRWDSASHYHSDGKAIRMAYSKWGGFINDIDRFEPEVFGITPREAHQIDPQQRILMEASYNCIRDAGYLPSDLDGKNVGVFVGISTFDYATKSTHYTALDDLDTYAATGTSLSIAANRLSYVYNLRGPSFAVDTACSSSLLATHLAAQSIWRKEADMALVGGVNAMLEPSNLIAFSKMGLLSPLGRCKAFSEEGLGFVRSEGSGVVMLKTLKQAQKDGDHIYALIRATAANQDGRTNGIALPNQNAQEELYRKVYKEAMVDPAQVGYVEAHGTGTIVGDLAEANSLGNVIGLAEGRKKKLLVGSIKTNIGHLEAGSGVAGLIKATLSMHHEVVPPNLHFEKPNPKINFRKLKLKVVEQPTSIKSAQFAGVNSFGFGGANVHVVLEKAPKESIRKSKKHHSPILPIRIDRQERTPVVLQSFLTYLRKTDASTGEIAAACNNDLQGEVLINVIGRDKNEWSNAIEEFLAKGESKNVLIAPEEKKLGRIAFVFSGQGPQWFAMGKRLYDEHARFRSWIKKCDRLVQRHVAWSVVEEISRTEEESQINDTALAQPIICVFQIALAHVLMEMGIKPEGVVGHSIGEIAAAHIAGAIDLPTAIKIIVYRGKTMGSHSLGGRMLAVSLPQSDLYKLTDVNDSEALNLAAINAPAAFTLAGTEDAIDRAANVCADENYFHRKLRVEHAFHSALMEPVHGPLIDALGGVEGTTPDITMISSVTTQEVTEKLDAEYWWQNVRQPVRFAPAVSQLIDKGFETFVEIAPHPVLLSSLLKIFSTADKSNLTAIPTIYRKSDEVLDFWRAIASLHSLGLEVDLAHILKLKYGKLILPGFPFLRSVYWSESYENQLARKTPIENLLLGKLVVNQRGTFINYLQLTRFPFLIDHQVRGVPMFPATGYIETFLAVLQSHLKIDFPYRLENFQFEKALSLKGEDAYAQSMVEYDERSHGISFFSRLRDEHDSWSLHCKAFVPQSTAGQVEHDKLEIDAIIDRLGEGVPGQYFYHGVSMSQIHFGPRFQGIKKFWTQSGEILTEIEAPRDLNLKDYIFHPALLDMTLQSSSTNRPPYLDTEIARYTLVPVRMGSFTLYKDEVTPKLYVHIVKERDSLRSALFDSKIYNAKRELIAEFTKVELYGIEALSIDDGSSFDDWVYYTDWHHQTSEESKFLPAKIGGNKSFDRAANKLARSLVARHVKRQNGQFLRDSHKAYVDCAFPSPAARKNLGEPQFESLIRQFPSRYEDILQIHEGVTAATTTPTNIHEIEILDKPSMALVSRAQDLLRQSKGNCKILELLYHRSESVLFALLPYFSEDTEYHVVVDSQDTWQRIRRERQVPPMVKVYALEPKQLMRKSKNFDQSNFDIILATQVGFIEEVGAVSKFSDRLVRLLAAGGCIVHEQVDQIPYWRLFQLDAQHQLWQKATGFYNGKHEVRTGTNPLLWGGKVSTDPKTVFTKDGLRVEVLEKSNQAKIKAEEASAQRLKVRIEIAGASSRSSLGKALLQRLSNEGIPSSIGEVQSEEDLQLLILDHVDSARFHKSASALDLQLDRWYEQIDFLRSHLNDTSEEIPDIIIATWGSAPLDEQDEGFSMKSAIWPGVIKSLQQEYPHLQLRHVQLDASESPRESIKQLVAEVQATDTEAFVAYRDGKRHVCRLRRGSLFYPAPILKADQRQVDRSRYRLQLGQGNSIDSVGFYEREATSLEKSEVEIEIRAAALNFRDVLKVLGLYPPDTDDYLNLGDECAGVVTRIGSGVKRFKVGDEVFAIGQSCFASHVVTHEDLTFSKPKKFSYEQATTVPVVFLTAYYSLIEVAKLEKGETVLIHAAAGGVGLAAIQIAQKRGANIIATASKTKQALLKGLGVQHVFNSRDVSFSKQILDITNGRGVDVVLNSLAGEAQEKSMELLAPFGRFVEIGKKDIYMDRNTGLYKFRENASFHVVDLSTLIKSRSAGLRRLVEETMSGFSGRNGFYPICHTVFDLSQIKEALRYMGKGSHIGKIVIDMRKSPVDIWPKVGKWQKPNANATYIIVGGAKGFGLGFTSFLALNGACNLVLFGRSEVSKSSIRQLRAAIGRQDDVKIIPMQVDVTDSDSVKAAFDQIKKTLPPVKGVVHTAGVYEDQLVNDITVDSFRKVCAPKTLGVWNLHQATRRMKLDFFTMTSSIASLLGNAGQVSYAAANSYLDAFAYYRRSLGLPATAINFGPIKGVGIIARSEMIESRMARYGIDMLPPHLGIQLTEFAINNRLSNVAAFRINFRDWLKGVPEDRIPSYLKDLHDRAENVDELGEHKEKILGRVLALDYDEAVEFVMDYIKQVTSKIIGVDPDTIAGQDNFQNIGLDSLMAVEMQHKIESALDVKLSAGEVAKDPTIQGLVTLVISKLRKDGE